MSVEEGAPRWGRVSMASTPQKSPEEEDLGVTGRMTTPSPSEATILQEEDLT